MTIEVFVFATGAVLLLIGIIGGGFEISVVKIPQVSWIPRILTFVAGVIFILIGLGINLKDKPAGIASDAQANLQQQQQPLQVAPIQPAQAQQVQAQQVEHELVPVRPPDPAVLDEHTKAALISAVRYADEVEISAGQTLNTDILTNAFTGEALRNERLNIETLKQSNQVQYSTLNSQQFSYFKLSADGLRAEVKLVENWRIYFYSLLTKECLGMLPDHDASQSIFLVKAEKGWIVETIVFDDTPQPQLVPCATTSIKK